MNLIEGLEDQKIALVLELVGNLSPHGTDLLQQLLLNIRIDSSCLDIKPVLAVRSVMVHIDDCIQTSFLGISDNFSHSVQPCLLNLVIRSFSDMSHPGNRYSYCSESCSLYLVERCLSCLRITPECLSRHSVVLGIEMVSEVPSYSEPFSKLPCKITVIYRGIGSAAVSSSLIFSTTRRNRSSSLRNVDILFLFSSHYRNSCFAWLRKHILLYGYSHDGLVVCRGAFLRLYPLVSGNEINRFRCSHGKVLFTAVCGEFQ